MNNAPIGLFDSGMGGLSVWRQLYENLPSESLIFFGDGLRCPYGSRSREEVLRFTVEAVEQLIDSGCKLIVIACNTATAVAIDHLRQHYPQIPFVGLEPAVKPAALTTKSGKIAVLATKRSLEGELFVRTSSQFADRVEILKAVGEGFVEIVEQGTEDSPEAEQCVAKVVRPLIEAGVDKIVLGCTHYPFLRRTIERVVASENIEIIDSGAAVCRRVSQLLEQHNMAADSQTVPHHSFITLGGDEYLQRMEKRAYGF